MVLSQTEIRFPMTVTERLRSHDLVAPAKVNLFLEIAGVQDDGYHIIDSLMGFLDVGDKVRLAPSDVFSLTLDGPYADIAPADESNLAARAVRLLEAHVGRDLPVHVHVEKLIPVGAGLGGGSADAAAVLRGMRALFDLNISDDELALMGLSLGADVPACLASVPVLVGGIGEKVQTAVSVPDLHLVLVHPGVSLSTPDVYAAYDRNHGNCACCGGGHNRFRPISPIDAIAQRRNDLEHAAVELEPLIVSVLACLSKTQGCQMARMSGSGTTCFGIYGDAGLAQAAHTELQAEFPGWWVCQTRLAGSEE